MISSIRGTVLSAVGSTVVIEVGGVGLAVHVTPAFSLSLSLGAEVRVRTALIVREDDLSLYGFAEDDELTVFDFLRSVTGVGPRSALGVLAVLSPAEIAHAVAIEDDAPFRKVSGIGPKTAKLIVLSLAGKIMIAPGPRAGAQTATTTVTHDVVVALVGLGWAERLAIQAVDDAGAVASEADRASVAALLRLALAQLGPQARSQEASRQDAR
jgi:Holliday junction DNA helicase RuvA